MTSLRPPHLPLYDAEDCASFRPGHQTHWIPGLRSHQTTGVEVSVVGASGHRILLQRADGETWHWFHHSPSTIDELASVRHEALAYPGLHLLGVQTTPTERSLISCAESEDLFAPCVTRWDRLFGPAREPA